MMATIDPAPTSEDLYAKIIFRPSLGETNQNASGPATTLQKNAHTLKKKSKKIRFMEAD